MAIDHPQHLFCFPTRFFRVPERILLQITRRCIKLNGGVTHDPFHPISCHQQSSAATQQDQAAQGSPQGCDHERTRLFFLLLFLSLGVLV
jgi:hypothetical protein